MNPSFWAPLIVLTAAPYVYAQQANSQSPDTVVKRAIEDVMSSIKTDPAASAGDPDALNRVVVQKFLPHTDFRRSTRFAVGNAWSKATPAQQDELFKQFQTLMVHTYATQLAQVSGQNMQFKFQPTASLPSNATDAVVKTIVNNNGDTMNIDYRLNRSDAGWKIYDINMMGAWMIGIYRQQFADQIAKGGINGLIKFLQAHNER
ncbi:MlaC/ttg2D family ABC transporter substrate-binding protein [Noviherbaspirillum massiliense]|uniref:MlaC/ttg2D family ABC transporter substrate-binding protein n=1 Tax=Noviherbaspirillum massiliense TaxID=1465823 RepID=UPI00031C9E90|nr:ABC transporter substrate-binding protein [Noviherbaspirillum massiliense]